MDKELYSKGTVASHFPPTLTELANSYRPIQLDDIQTPLTSTAEVGRGPPCTLLQRKDILSPHFNHRRTNSSIRASCAASTSRERSDNHRAIINHGHSLTLRERYDHGRRALQNSSAGPEFVLMWEVLAKLKKVIRRALDRRARKNAKAKAKQVAPNLEPFKHQPDTTIPTPIYDAHRKHRSNPAPQEFYIAYEAIKNQPRTPSPPPLPIIRRKPVPATSLRIVPKYPVLVSEPLQTLRRSNNVRLEGTATPRSVPHPRESRMTRFSDFIHHRSQNQSSISTGSAKQTRQCEVCGVASSGANVMTLGKRGLWLCSGCQRSDGSSGELPPLSLGPIQRHRSNPTSMKGDHHVPPSKHLVWKCEHCSANFSSALPAQGNLCICPICKNEIATHLGAVSRTQSEAGRNSQVSQRQSSRASIGNERSFFSQVSEISEGEAVVGDEDFVKLVARPSIYRPSLYEDAPVPGEESPVSPIGKGRFDDFDGAIHPAFRPLPLTQGLARVSPNRQPATELRDNTNAHIPGIDKDHSYQRGPNTHLTYEFPSTLATPSAATTAMDLSLPLIRQSPQNPAPSLTKSRKKPREAQYEKLRGIKHATSSIYPEDEDEKVYTSNKPLPAMPREPSCIPGKSHDVDRESFYPMSPEQSELERFLQAAPLTEADRVRGTWPVNASNGTLPVNRRSSFYGFVSSPFHC